MTASPRSPTPRRSPLGLSARSLMSVGLICTACAHFSSGEQRGMRMIPAGAAVAPAAPERSSFAVLLVAADGRTGSAPAKGAGSANISLRSDNVLVYAVQVDNVAGETFTQAQVVRMTGDSSVDVIATLFSDVVVRGRRISLRGTASLARTLPADALLANVREHPDEYRVIVRAEHHPLGSLVGFLGTSR